MAWLENRLPPPILAVLVAAMMGAIAFLFGASVLPRAVSIGVALGLAGVAGIFGLPAFVAFGKAATTVDPVRIDRASALVTTGVYAVTRNPMYVSLTLFLVGWAAFLGRPLVFAGPIVFVAWITRFQIVPEERVLAAKFGSPYAEYRARVRRWL